MQKHEYTISVPTTKTVYVSDDGISFDTEEECMAHETKYKALVDYVSHIPHKFAEMMEIEECASDDEELLIFYTIIEPDIYAIQQWAAMHGCHVGPYKAGDVIIFDCAITWMHDVSVGNVTDLYRCLGTPDEYKKHYINAIDKVVQS